MEQETNLASGALVDEPVNKEMQTSIQQNSSKKNIVLLFFLLILVLGLAFFFLRYSDKLLTLLPTLPQKTSDTPYISGSDFGFKKFTSFEEYKAYLESANSSLGGSMVGYDLGTGRVGLSEKSNVALQAPVAATADRVSETNVQVKGVDEPDIVKTDGKTIFVSTENYNIVYSRPVSLEKTSISPLPPEYRGTTKLLSAIPVESISKKSEINSQGDLLYFENILLVFTSNKIYGYDVSDNTNPSEVWNFEFDDRSQVLDARLIEGKLYLISKTVIDPANCVIPLRVGDSPLDINCTEVYHPTTPVVSDSTFTTLVIDAKSGAVQKKVSFLGSSGSSIVYMNKDNLYVTYTFYEDLIKFYYSFYTEDGKGIIPDYVVQKIKALVDLSISGQAKATEFAVIMQTYQNTLTNDDRLKVETETQNILTEYTKKHLRELEKTGIVRISVSELSVAASGSVPGKPLNQFSLDEEKSVLRIATTIGNNFFSSGSSVSDVYTLDKTLKVLGSVSDLGKGEKIYAVRFLGDKGYVVTFKQTDPFYVLDLAQPTRPQMVGELKIPGYSSYLHPVTSDLILGVGKEDQKVKVSLFSVSDPKNPKEVGKYTLDEYWSEALSTHKAFLQDEKHSFIFVPGNKGGYVLGYSSDGLKLLKAVSMQDVKRSLFVADNLYILSGKELKVFSEENWELLKSIEF